MGLFTDIIPKVEGDKQQQPIAGGGLFSDVLNKYNSPVERARRNADAAQKNYEKVSSPLNIAKETAVHTAKSLYSIPKNAITGGTEGWKSVETREKRFSNLLRGPQEAEYGADVMSETLSDTLERYRNLKKTFTEEAKTGDKVASVMSAGLGTVNAIFSPVNGIIQMLKGVPGVGHTADKLDQVFAAIGSGATKVAVAGWRDVPFVSQETRDTFEPIIAETAALAGMAVAGKASGAQIKRLNRNVNEITTAVKNVEDVAGAIDRTPGVGTNAPQKLNVLPEPTTLPVQRVGSPKPERVPVRQEYDPVVPPDQLPTIQYGKGAPKKNEFPVIDAGPETGVVATQKIPGLKYEPIKPPTKQPSVIPPTPKEVSTPKVTKPKPKKEAPVWKTDELPSDKPPTLQTKKVSEKTDYSITNEKFVEEANRRSIIIEEKLDTIQKKNMAESWKSADDFVSKSPASSRSVVDGNIKPPSGLTVGDVYSALAVKALREGDVTLSNYLAKTKVGTEAAQNLKSFDRPLDIDTVSNPVETIRYLYEQRKSNVGEKAFAKEKAKAGKIAPTNKNAWLEFLKDIQC